MSVCKALRRAVALALGSAAVWRSAANACGSPKRTDSCSTFSRISAFSLPASLRCTADHPSGAVTLRRPCKASCMPRSTSSCTAGSLELARMRTSGSKTRGAALGGSASDRSAIPIRRLAVAGINGYIAQPYVLQAMESDSRYDPHARCVKRDHEPVSRLRWQASA
jgi:hypothetical protein